MAGLIELLSLFVIPALAIFKSTSTVFYVDFNNIENSFSCLKFQIKYKNILSFVYSFHFRLSCSKLAVNN